LKQREKTLKGQEIENYIKKIIQDHAPIKRLYSGGDFLIGTRTILEVKSSEVCQSAGVKKGHKPSVFIVDPEAHEELKNNDWYALVLTFKSQVLLLRFLKAKYLHVIKCRAKHGNLYHKKALSVEQFVELIKKE